MKEILLNENTCNYLKGKIKWNSYSDKKILQYILELSTLEDYLVNWFRWPYYHWFALDYLMEKHFEDYINLIEEIKWKDESIKIKKNFRKKEKLLCNWINFSYRLKLNNLEDRWIYLWWIK
jgi:hypothetical protein